MLKDLSQAKTLSKKYQIPLEDILLIALNCSGINADLSDKRIRFRLKLDGCKEEFYIGVCVNTGESPFYFRVNDLFLNKEHIGKIIERENDTCDSTYFRRNKTAMTLNSNSRSRCFGCKFCGTYNLDAEDLNSLLLQQKLSNYFKKFLAQNKIKDLSNFVDIGICTGCFLSEELTVDHILMVRNVLKRFKFDKELKYLGSQIRSENSFKILKEKAMPFSLYLTIEVFNNREKWLRSSKADVTINEAKNILKLSAKYGFEYTFLYILGIEPVDVVIKRFKEFAPLINSRFPIINLFQIYIPNQRKYRAKNADKIEYYLKVRKELEKIFKKKKMRPRPWEDYRGLWYLRFGNEPIKDYRI